MSTKAGTRKKPSKLSPNPPESSIVPNPSGQVLNEINPLTPEIAGQILLRLAAGETLRAICQSQGMPSEVTIRTLAIKDDAFATHYTRARDIGMDSIADNLLTVAADKGRDANCRRVEVDAIKWYLSKIAPKRYGERLQVDTTINAGPSIVEILRGRIEARAQIEEKNEQDSQ